MSTPTAAQTSRSTSRTPLLMMRWWVALVPLFFVNAVSQIDKLGIAVMMSNKGFLADMHLIGKPGTTGLLVTGFLVAYSFFHFFWAYWIKRFGPRASGILGITLWALTFLLSAAAYSATQLIIARTVLGVGEAVLYPMGSAFVANWFPMRERGRAISIWNAGNHVGGAVCGALIVALIALGSWRGVFVELCLLNLLVPLPLMIFVLRDRPSQSRLVTPAERAYIESGSLALTKEVPKPHGNIPWYSNYRFWMATFCWGLHNVYFWGWTTWMPTYFQSVHHFSFQSAGYLYSFSFALNVIAYLIAGFLSDRFMRRAPFGPIGWGLAGILILVGGSLSDPYWAAGVLLFVTCTAGIAFPINIALIQSFVREESMGVGSAVASGVSQIIAMAAPALLGVFIGLHGFNVVTLCLAVVLFVAAALQMTLLVQGY
jgi:ACS family glucarate transporter-like MFS transporter